MNKKLVITKQNNLIRSSFFDGNDMLQVNVEEAGKKSILGNIYVGKVKNIVKNINAAFVEIQDGIMCYFSLQENRLPIFTNPKTNNKVNVGDEIIVQVSRENVKTKAPVVTGNLNFTGKYVVLTHGKTLIGVSGKIASEKKREELKQIVMEYHNDQYGFIIRTNAVEANAELIKEEIKSLIQLYTKVREYGIHKTRFSLIHQTPANYLCDIRDGLSKEVEEIVTDDEELWKEIQTYLEIYQKEDLSKLRLYQDNLISLNHLYSIQIKIERALNSKVWLKSGGSIVIEPTEALTVIDVNTGKAIAGKKNVQETFFKINREAAKEIAKQIRLRNLSGIIIIDFIDMIAQEHKSILMKELETLFLKDPIKTIVVDLTPLNLVEITRKKVRRPLHEQMMGLNNQ